jgi:hypothetical protein
MTSENLETKSDVRTFSSFHDFWPFYLGEHSTLQCRVQHFLGTAIAVTFVSVALMTGNGSWLVLAVICGYACAWWGHFVFEKNRPATFRFPIYSFMGDWKMFWMMMVGTLDDEIRRLGIRPRR